MTQRTKVSPSVPSSVFSASQETRVTIPLEIYFTGARHNTRPHLFSTNESHIHRGETFPSCYYYAAKHQRILQSRWLPSTQNKHDIKIDQQSDPKQLPTTNRRKVDRSFYFLLLEAYIFLSDLFIIWFYRQTKLILQLISGNRVYFTDRKKGRRS